MKFEYDGAATMLIPRSKSDVAREGRFAYVSPKTAALLSCSVDGSELQRSPLFTSIVLMSGFSRPLLIRLTIMQAGRRVWNAQ